MRAALMAVGKNKDLSYAKDEVDVRLADGTEIRALAAKGGYMGGTPERPYPDFIEVDENERECLLIEMDENAPKTIHAALDAVASDLLVRAPIAMAVWPTEDGPFTMIVKNRFGPTGPVRVAVGRRYDTFEEPKSVEEELREARNHVASLLRRDDVSDTDRVTDEEAARGWLAKQ